MKFVAGCLTTLSGVVGFLVFAWIVGFLLMVFSPNY